MKQRRSRSWLFNGLIYGGWLIPVGLMFVFQDCYHLVSAQEGSAAASPYLKYMNWSMIVAMLWFVTALIVGFVRCPLFRNTTDQRQQT